MALALPSSGTYGFAPSAGEQILYAFRKCGIKRSAIEEEHLVDARMATNLLLSEWSNDQPHLWEVDLLSIPLQQGISNYTLPGNTVIVLDAYLRTYSLPNVTNATPQFSTQIGQALVTIGLTNHGLSPGQWVNVVVPVSVGGIVVFGYYQVSTVPNGNAFTVIAAANATSTVTNGGVVPVFAGVTGLSSVTVYLPNHGLLSGFTWNVQVATAVGGVTISGAYTVATVIDANTFTISAAQELAFPQSAGENGGLAQFAAQSSTVQPLDRILWPVGRSEYAAYPNKNFQAPPTVTWFDRTIVPSINTYPTPDGNGPYALQLYRVKQIQDVNVSFGQVVDVPYRFLAAYNAGLAKELAISYAPERYVQLKAIYDEIYGKAEGEDNEHVPLYIIPQLRSFYRR